MQAPVNIQKNRITIYKTQTYISTTFNHPNVYLDE